MAGKAKSRRDSKHRILRRGESIRADGKYQFKYHVNGKPHFVYSWRLEPTDTLPVGKKPCLSLRELEKQIGYDLDSLSDPLGKTSRSGSWWSGTLQRKREPSRTRLRITGLYRTFSEAKPLTTKKSRRSKHRTQSCS